MTLPELKDGLARERARTAKLEESISDASYFQAALSRQQKLNAELQSRSTKHRDRRAGEKVQPELLKRRVS